MLVAPGADLARHRPADGVVRLGRVVPAVRDDVVPGRDQRGQCSSRVEEPHVVAVEPGTTSAIAALIISIRWPTPGNQVATAHPGRGVSGSSTSGLPMNRIRSTSSLQVVGEPGRRPPEDRRGYSARRAFCWRSPASSRWAAARSGGSCRARARPPPQAVDVTLQRLREEEVHGLEQPVVEHHDVRRPREDLALPVLDAGRDLLRGHREVADTTAGRPWQQLALDDPGVGEVGGRAAHERDPVGRRRSP